MIKVSLDRVTVVGTCKCSWEMLNEKLHKIGWTDMSINYEDNYVDGYKLLRRLDNESTETIAVLVKNPYRTTWRLDSSNHIKESNELRKISNALDLFFNLHLSRIDIAFDFINLENSGMRHRFTKPGISISTIKGSSLWMQGRSGHIETIYAGKRKSLSMFRYYDKVAEQKKRRKSIPEDIKSWERLEMQVRGSRTDEWLINAKIMLNYFKLPAEFILKPSDRAMVSALNSGIVSYKELAKATRAKYRKLARENSGYDNSWARLGHEALQKNANRIQKDVDRFLNMLET